MSIWVYILIGIVVFCVGIEIGIHIRPFDEDDIDGAIIIEDDVTSYVSFEEDEALEKKYVRLKIVHTHEKQDL